MPAFIQSAITEWGLFAAALLCFAGAVAAFIYIPVVGQWIAIVLFGLGVGLVTYDLGYKARGEIDDSGVIQAQLDEANHELAATQKVARDFATKQASAEADAAQQQDKINAYEATLRAAPEDGGCDLTDDDVRSLSNIGASSAPNPPRRPAGLRAPGKSPGTD